MVEEIAEEITVGLLTAGIASGTKVTASTVRRFFQYNSISVNIDRVSTVFYNTLKKEIERKNEQLDTKELSDFSDNWPDIVENLTSSRNNIGEISHNTDPEFSLLFKSEKEAVEKITQAYADVHGFNIEDAPECRDAIEDALIEAYKKTVSDFKQRIAGTELASEFQTETSISLKKQLIEAQKELDELEKQVEFISKKNIFNEGFIKLTPRFFDRQSASPETCWQTEFSLADVEENIPAEREGIKQDTASQELFEQLESGESRLVVGQPGSGKSTLCKQVAIKWYNDTDLGTVFYRERGSGDTFRSHEDLKRTINRAKKPILIVVEDCVRPEANYILKTFDYFESDPSVRFLFDARSKELQRFKSADSTDNDINHRYRKRISNILHYQLPPLSEEDVVKVCHSFENSTGKTIHRDTKKLYKKIQPRAQPKFGIGEMLILVFSLPIGHGSEINSEGLQAHVDHRYKAVHEPNQYSISSKLSAYSQDLIEDIGVMVNMLNASGIGIHQELVHALGYEYGNTVEVHDEIEQILTEFEGWFLFPTTVGDAPRWTMHELWSTLYLRNIAIEHRESQKDSQRRDLSEPHISRCLKCIFNVLEGGNQREELLQEFPDSYIINSMSANEKEKSAKYIKSILQLGKQWPVLAPLFGTSDTARYELPDIISDEKLKELITMRGDSHRFRGGYAKAKTEYEFAIEISKKKNNDQGIADSLNNLGVVAAKQGNHDIAEKHHNQALEIGESLNDENIIGNSLHNLGKIEFRRDNYENSREYFRKSLEFRKKANDRRGEAITRNGLGAAAFELGDRQIAQEQHEKSIEIAEKLDDRRIVAINMNNLGRVAVGLKNYDNAMEYHNQSLKLRRVLDDQVGIATSLLNLGRVERKKDNHQEAREYFKDSYDKYSEIGAMVRALDALDDLVTICKDIGQKKKALEYCREGFNIIEEIDLPENKKEHDIFQEHYEELSRSGE